MGNSLFKARKDNKIRENTPKFEVLARLNARFGALVSSVWHA